VSRRGATAIRGVLPIDKPAGMTSHDVVARIRRATGEGRVGHAGTLDPAATGLLVVLLGPYTRLEPYLSSATKAYDARISFGVETDTDDAEGTAVRSAPVREGCLDPDRASEVLSSLVGPSLQTPPAFSAIKVGGKIAHRAARAGAPLLVEPREIEVFEARLQSLDRGAKTWDVSFRVSKGTYIRALARDLGRACNSAAHLSALRRTASGNIALADATALDEAVAAIGQGGLQRLLLDPFRALGLAVLESGVGATRAGAVLPRPADLELSPGQVLAISEAGTLTALYRVDGDFLAPAVVLPEVTAA